MESGILNITVDGMTENIENGSDIVSLLEKIGVMSDRLSIMPLAAMIGGRIYDLHYKLKHDCDIRIIRYGCEEGRRVYERSLKFVLICAVKTLYPNAIVTERYSLGKGVYITVDKNRGCCSGDMLTEKDADAIFEKCKQIVNDNIKFERKRISTEEAVSYFETAGQLDKCELLKWRQHDTFDVYTLDGYDVYDYYYGQMLPSTKYLKVFELTYHDGALIMLMPSVVKPTEAETYVHPKKLSAVFAQMDKWDSLMGCETVADLNRHVENGTLRDLIRLNEILHQRMFAKAADEIKERNVKAILVAGPSSSGKTTSANRLKFQLKTLGSNPELISLDNYYIDRDKVKPDENGELNLEHINSLDIKRFSSDLERLLAGQSVEIPVFNFVTGKREKDGIVISAGANNPIIIEGIHGLNPQMLTGAIDENKLFRIYVSALTTLNLDNHNRIRTSDVRLIRRLVRDFATRAASMEHTLSMWDSVRRGEEKWIFPFQEQADMILNTTLVYELAVMKKYVYELLSSVPTESAYYSRAKELVEFLSYFADAGVEVENEIPPTSIMREFIGGNTFYM